MSGAQTVLFPTPAEPRDLRAELAAATRTILLIEDALGLPDAEAIAEIETAASTWHRIHGTADGRCQHCTDLLGGPCTCGLPHILRKPRPACPIHTGHEGEATT